MCLCFFFFKQKTAYEMRISDWSSDVCSSDLVEHTVTEAVTGLDLVEMQLRLAGGATLRDLGLADGAGPAPRGMAMQLRINTETMQPDASATPGAGLLTPYEPPAAPAPRVHRPRSARHAPHTPHDPDQQTR